MVKYAFVLLACLLALAVFWLGGDGQKPVSLLFDNMSMQDRQGDQARNGGEGLLMSLRPVPAQTVPARMGDAPSDGASGARSDVSAVFVRPGHSYLTTGKSGGSYGQLLPAELGGMGNRDAVASRGEAVFKARCVVCHGQSASGDGIMSTYPDYPEMPSLLKDKYVAYPLGQLFWSVAKGQGNMPAFEKRLSAADLWSVSHYIRVLQDGKDKDDE